MAADFTLIPTLVTPLEPEFPNIITESEAKKQYQNLDPTPIEKYKLNFIRTTDVNYWIINDHYRSTYGGYDSFKWNSVPSYATSSSTPNMTGRWVEGSFKSTPNAKSWDVEIVFEKAF